VLGAVLNSGQSHNTSPTQGQGGLGGMNLGALIPVLAPVLMNMLSNNGAQGGLGGLADKFNQAGLGDVMNSWIGKGDNQPVSGDQLTTVLGTDTLGHIANQLGMNQGDAAGALSHILPGLIDQLTPHGQVPAEGVGHVGDVMGLLGGLLQQR